MRRSKNITQLLALSLFMIVLAFFLVLNTISEFRETKVIPVMASLEAEFASKILGKEGAPALTGDTSTPNLFSGGEIHDLQMSFRNNFDVLATKMNTSGTILQVEMRRHNFIDILQKANTLGFGEFRKKLLLFMNNTSQPYRMDVTFNEKDPLNASLDDQKMMPELLIKTGFVQGNFKITTRVGDPDLITLIFTPQSTSLTAQEKIQ